MVIKLDKINKFILVVLLTLPILVSSIEINIVVILLILAYVIIDINQKFSLTFINVIAPLIGILLISILTSLFYPSTIFDIIKDFFFLLKPVIYILVGYTLCRKIEDKSYIFKLIIYLAIFFAIIHLGLSFSFLFDNEFNINKIRNYAGKSNTIEIFAIVLLLSKKGKQLYRFKSKFKRLFILILLTSFIFYFSRTASVSLIILILATNGYLIITQKGLFYMFGFIIFTALFYTYLFSINIERGADGIDGFLYKLKIAPSEIFDSKINKEDHRDLWDHWRAYEAQMAIEQLDDTPYNAGLFFGKGVGSLVDLGFVAPLNKEGIQYISTLHNGYSFILFKSGLFGLLSYLIFLFIVYMQSYTKKYNYKVVIVNNLLSGMAVYYMFTTLIVSGIYNPRDFSGIFMGALLYLQFYHRTQKDNFIN